MQDALKSLEKDFPGVDSKALMAVVDGDPRKHGLDDALDRLRKLLDQLANCRPPKKSPKERAREALDDIGESAHARKVPETEAALEALRQAAPALAEQARAVLPELAEPKKAALQNAIAAWEKEVPTVEPKALAAAGDPVDTRKHGLDDALERLRKLLDQLGKAVPPKNPKERAERALDDIGESAHARQKPQTQAALNELHNASPAIVEQAKAAMARMGEPQKTAMKDAISAWEKECPQVDSKALNAAGDPVDTRRHGLDDALDRLRKLLAQLGKTPPKAPPRDRVKEALDTIADSAHARNKPVTEAALDELHEAAPALAAQARNAIAALAEPERVAANATIKQWEQEYPQLDSKALAAAGDPVDTRRHGLDDALERLRKLLAQLGLLVEPPPKQYESVSTQLASSGMIEAAAEAAKLLAGLFE
jgi:DNA repair exonuclease SbcCD ATPase subunit